MTDEKENTESYIARCKCGCNGIIVAIVNLPQHTKAIAKEVASCIREGYSIERVTVGYVRSHPFGCRKEDKQQSFL